MNVHQLVKSLTPAQQRYFRVYASLHSPEGKTSKYMTAFDSVLTGKKLKKKSEETELFAIVLAVMRSFSSSGPAREVRNAIHDAEFLISKAMYSDAAVVLRTAEKSARELELFGAQTDVINLRAELMQLAGFRKDQSVGKVLNDELTMIEHMENVALYRQYSLTLFEKIRSKGKGGVNEQQAYLQHVLKDPLLKNENRAITLRAKIIRLQLHATAHLLKGEVLKALSFQKQLVALMSDHPAQVKWKPFNHVILLNNHTITALRCSKYREAKNSIEAMRRIPEQFSILPTAELRAQIFSFAAVLELDLHMRRSDIATGVRRATVFLREVKPHVKYISPSLYMVLLFNCGHLLFAKGEIKKAYSQFSAITQLPYKGVREDLMSASRLLQALCLYEEGETDHLSYVVINLKRQAKKVREQYSSEIALLNTIGKVIDSDELKQQILWKKLLEKLQELKGNSLDAALYENFDILKWVKKQIDY